MHGGGRMVVYFNFHCRCPQLPPAGSLTTWVTQWEVVMEARNGKWGTNGIVCLGHQLLTPSLRLIQIRNLTLQLQETFLGGEEPDGGWSQVCGFATSPLPLSNQEEWLLEVTVLRGQEPNGNLLRLNLRPFSKDLRTVYLVLSPLLIRGVRVPNFTTLSQGWEVGVIVGQPPP